MPIWVRVLNPDILTDEDVLVESRVKIALSEDLMLKREAASEGEDESGGYTTKGSGKYRRTSYQKIRSSGQSLRRAFFKSSRQSEAYRKRLKILIKQAHEPPIFKKRAIQIVHNRPIFYVEFERLGKLRCIEIECKGKFTYNNIQHVLESELSDACLLIPYREIVIEHLSDYFKDKAVRGFRICNLCNQIFASKQMRKITKGLNSCPYCGSTFIRRIKKNFPDITKISHAFVKDVYALLNILRIRKRKRFDVMTLVLGRKRTTSFYSTKYCQETSKLSAASLDVDQKRSKFQKLKR